jgi:hypothetical protein
MIGGEKRIFNQQNFIYPLFTFSKQGNKEEVRDAPRRHEVEKIMTRVPTVANKAELKKILIATKDKSLKVQIALIFGPWFDPVDDCIGELVDITNESIWHLKDVSTQSGSPIGQLAALMAYKGMYLSALFTREYIQHAYKEAVGKHNNAGLTAINRREIDYKEQQMLAVFEEAEAIAKASKDPESLAVVYIEKGQAAAHRAAMFTSLRIPSNHNDVTIMRDAFAQAEAAFHDAAEQFPSGGELEIANVRHNFANCLRMLGEQESAEAKIIEAEVIEVARKYGDYVLLTKAEAIMDRLNGKEVPNYYEGERGEPLI